MKLYQDHVPVTFIDIVSGRIDVPVLPIPVIRIGTLWQASHIT